MNYRYRQSTFGQISTQTSEHVWSNIDSDIIYGFRFVDKILNQFVSFNVRSFETTDLIKIADAKACSIGRGEGSQSNDDQFILFVCGEEEGVAELISFNIAQNEIIGRLVIKEFVNWASVSQSGQYVVVESSFAKDSPRRLSRYSIDLQDTDLLSEERH